ncbi:MAG: hypothetical protein ACRD3S_20330, partial [Terracidiphilus sp.]
IRMRYNQVASRGRLTLVEINRRNNLALNHMTRKVALLFCLLFVSAGAVSAQSASLYYAGGTATDSSSGPLNTLGAGVTFNTPKMGGFFETIGGDVIFRHKIGVGAEISFRNSRGPYAGIEYRPSFYDVNAVYYPLSNLHRIAPEIQGGVGRSKLAFYYAPQFCVIAPQGCGSSTGQISTVNHPELHFSGGVRFYVWRNAFVRPQVDIRWVKDFADFGSSWVPEYSLAVGYTFGELRTKR